jgi:hypothetical protein
MIMARSTRVIEVDERELATILASLRFWQLMLESGTSLNTATSNPERIRMLLMISTNAGHVVPMTADEIDKLSERLNIGN